MTRFLGWANAATPEEIAALVVGGLERGLGDGAEGGAGLGRGVYGPIEQRGQGGAEVGGGEAVEVHAASVAPERAGHKARRRRTPPENSREAYTAAPPRRVGRMIRA